MRIQEMVIPPEEKRRNTEEIKTSIIKWSNTKYLIIKRFNRI